MTPTIQVTFDLISIPNRFIIKDISNYTSLGYTAANVKGNLKIFAPSGAVVHENTDYLNPDIKYVGAALNEYDSLAIPVDYRGRLQAGLYKFEYRIQISGVAHDTLIFQYNYQYIQPKGTLSHEVNLELSTLYSRDQTKYPSTATVVRTHTLKYPTDLNIVDTVYAKVEVEISPIYTNTWATSLSSLVTDAVATNVKVLYRVDAIDGFDVESIDFMTESYTYLKKLRIEFNDLQRVNLTSASRVQKLIDDLLRNLNTYDRAIRFGDYAYAAEITQNIKAYLCDCDCKEGSRLVLPPTDPNSGIISFQLAGSNYVITTDKGVYVAPAPSGGGIGSANISVTDELSIVEVGNTKQISINTEEANTTLGAPVTVSPTKNLLIKNDDFFSVTRNFFDLFPPNAKVIYISVTGDNTTGKRGNFFAPFRTLSAAKLVWQDGDVFHWLPGTYDAEVTLNGTTQNYIHEMDVGAIINFATDIISADNAATVVVRGQAKLTGHSIVCGNATARAAIECANIYTDVAITVTTGGGLTIKGNVNNTGAWNVERGCSFSYREGTWNQTVTNVVNWHDYNTMTFTNANIIGPDLRIDFNGDTEETAFESNCYFNYCLFYVKTIGTKKTGTGSANVFGGFVYFNNTRIVTTDVGFDFGRTKSTAQFIFDGASIEPPYGSTVNSMQQISAGTTYDRVVNIKTTGKGLNVIRPIQAGRIKVISPYSWVQADINVGVLPEFQSAITGAIVRGEAVFSKGRGTAGMVPIYNADGTTTPGTPSTSSGDIANSSDVAAGTAGKLIDAAILKQQQFFNQFYDS